MTMPSSPCSRITRRTRLRTSVGVRAGVSSIYSGTSLSLLTAVLSLGQSSCSSLPLRILVWSIRPTEDSMRMISESAGISMLNTRMGLAWLRMACSTRFMAKLVLPMEGRPATITRSAGCRPEVMPSRSLNPVLRPVISPPELNSSSILPMADCNSGLTDWGPPALGPCSEICMMRRSASSISSSGVRPSGLNPLSAISWAASISLRRLARSLTTWA